MSLIGKVGEERGPTLDQVRLAARLRANFKQGLAWMAKSPEPNALEAPEPPEPEEGDPGATPYDDGPEY